MRVRWHREARIEADEAAGFYGQGDRVLTGVFSTFWRMLSTESAVALRGRYPQVRAPTFPIRRHLSDKI